MLSISVSGLYEDLDEDLYEDDGRRRILKGTLSAGGKVPIGKKAFRNGPLP